jgi:hypothetical protein
VRRFLAGVVCGALLVPLGAAAGTAPDTLTKDKPGCRHAITATGRDTRVEFSCPIGFPVIWVYVDGQQLIYASTDRARTTLTYYGYGMVVRVRQYGHRYVARAASVRYTPARLTIRLTPQSVR